ncbi:hypothetical protein [Palleronia pelagia]|uniref:Uncharacterized protein n=1 Tax=Palleronia pelagia TaxID=387096 RepID=A0A1H8DL12_9RHOB|nr:hypothetical protein [Palleronia pelagia]SEN07228.1 hypothetical protein SAMN04488011_102359 [Palleronia pelagia]
MVFDIPQMIATGLIVLLILWIVDHTAAFEGASKGRKTLYKFVGMFILLFILGLIWPYGTGA